MVFSPLYSCVNAYNANAVESHEIPTARGNVIEDVS